MQPVRDYPHGSLGSHLFGYVGAITEQEYERLKHQGYSPNDVIGKDGLEYEYDGYLRGVPGGQRVIVDSSGAVVSAVSSQAAVPGDTLVTNVDWRLQQIVEQALSQGHCRLGPRPQLSGAAVVEDPWTGGILALASFPNFDPEDFSADKFARIRYYLESPTEPLFDRAIAAATPTGSTFKMVTGSAALTEGVVKVDQVVYDTGGWNCGGYYARDIAAGGLGNTTFIPALAASSDGYFFRLSWWLGNDRLRKYALAFGLNAKTGIDLPGENEGNWPTNAWSMRVFGVPMEPGDACFLGIGQGAMQATPLQMANIASAVINGGTLFAPQIVREIRSPDGRIVKTFRTAGDSARSGDAEGTGSGSRGMARVTDPGGTAYGLAIRRPEVLREDRNGRDRRRQRSEHHVVYRVGAERSSEVAMAVFVDRSGGYGAQVAAPIARQIMVKYFNEKVREALIFPYLRHLGPHLPQQTRPWFLDLE